MHIIPMMVGVCGCVQDPLEFPAHELRKYFRMGDHVKVIAGRYEGDTGLIVRVEENFVILFSDLTMHEVFVPAAPPPPPRVVGSVLTVCTVSSVEGVTQRPAALL